MRNGVNYRDYVEDIKEKVRAWGIVADCFTFSSESFSDKVRIYFESLEYIFDSAWPCLSPSEAKGSEPVSEQECIDNIKDNIDFIEHFFINTEAYNAAAENRQGFYGRVVENLERALKYRFGVEVER